MVSSFGPTMFRQHRTAFAVITASALGSAGCYASNWMSGSGGKRTTSASSAAAARGGIGGGPTAGFVGLASGIFEIMGSSPASCTPASTLRTTAATLSSSSSSPFSSAAATDSSQISLKPLVVCGPSGVGKGTLINMLLQDFPGRFGFSVSHTTRKPRLGEVNGTHYHFSEKAAMQAEIDDAKFIEHANVHGNLYGTSIAAVQSVTASDKICILDIDVQGVKSVRNASTTVLDPHYLFIAPPSIEVLEARLRGRGTETEEQLSRRLANSRAEMEYGTEPGNFEKILVNDGLQEAYAELKVTATAWYPQLQEGRGQQAATPSAN